MSIVIHNTSHLFTPKQAKTWCKKHVVVSRKDLARIAKLAKKHGLYAELKALGVETRDLSTRDE